MTIAGLVMVGGFDATLPVCRNGHNTDPAHRRSSCQRDGTAAFAAVNARPASQRCTGHRRARPSRGPATPLTGSLRPCCEAGTTRLPPTPPATPENNSGRRARRGAPVDVDAWNRGRQHLRTISAGTAEFSSSASNRPTAPGWLRTPAAANSDSSHGGVTGSTTNASRSAASPTSSPSPALRVGATAPRAAVSAGPAIRTSNAGGQVRVPPVLC